jgi:hypothetical protein
MALLAGLGVTALVAGGGIVIVTLAALRGQDPRSFVPPSWYYTTTLALSALGAAAGGFAAARITHGRSLFTVLVLALVLLMPGIAPGLRSTAAPTHPESSSLTLALIRAFGVLAGGALERRRTWGQRVSGAA